ncbi:MAG: hypothetical protein ACLGGY_06685 [Gammaproteobacteria bacterium]
MKIARIASLLSGVFLFGTSITASAAVFYLNQFSVSRNGVLIFNDTFDVGGPPPQAPNFLSNGNPASYFVQGTMGPEAGGKLALNPAQDGILIPNIAGNPVNLVQKATLETNINPAALTSGLKQGNAFAIQAVYDLVVPDVVGREGYGIRLEDFGGATGGNDVFEIAVRRLENHAIALRFRELDFLDDFILDISDYVLTAGDLLNQQVMLQLSTIGNSSTLQAGFALGNGGVFGPVSFLAGTGSIFTDENYTRGVIIARTAPAQVPLPATLWLVLAGLGALRIGRGAGKP